MSGHTKRNARIVSLRSQGVGQREIARRMGLSASVVGGVLTRTGWRNVVPRLSWTPERERRLSDLWLSGRSASEIAEELGVSREAVCGKVSRMGLKREAAPRPIRPRVRASSPADAVVSTPRAQRAAPPKAETPPRRPVGPAEAAPVGAVLLVGRRRGQCAWPVGAPSRPAEQMACGARVREEGCSWCEAHARRAWTRDLSQPRSNRLVRLAGAV